MKNLYLLMLLLTGITGFATPPVIYQPNPLHACDTNTDGIAVFDLTVTIPEILGPLNPALYTVTFYETATDSELGINPIVSPNTYANITPISQNLWVRVEDNATLEYSLTGLSLIADPFITGTMGFSTTGCGGGFVTLMATGGSSPYTFTYMTGTGPIPQMAYTDGENFVNIPLPEGTWDITLIAVTSGYGHVCCEVPTEPLHVVVNPATIVTAGQPQDIIISQDPYVGSAMFDLTTNGLGLAMGNPNLTVTYFTTEADATTGINPIADPTAFFGNNGQTIWARVQDTFGCYALRTFQLYITNPDIVFIPDANLKLRMVLAGTNVDTFFVAQDLTHNYTIIDANGDGEIQYSEAANISLLNAGSGNIADMTGLEAFVNMKYLNISYNPQLTSVNLSTMPLLETLAASHCALTTISFANNPLVSDFSCEYNQLTSLDMSVTPSLIMLRCQNNQLTSLNLTGLTLLNDMWCSDNQLTSLNTNDLQGMLYFNASANQITSLDLTGMPIVQQLLCEHNQITSLDTTGCTSLTNLRCAYNGMTSLDVSGSPALNNLDCSVNNFTALDLSNNHSLCNLNCHGNFDMTWLNIKNGVDACYTNYDVYFMNSATAASQFLCCDDNEVAFFKNYYLNYSINANVNSYCSFEPGGDYNTIAATAQFDANNNGCDVSDNSFPNVRFNIFDGTNSGAAFTGVNGSASFYTQAGSFDITPAIENPTWFTISPPTTTVPFANINNNTALANFCIASNGVHPDLEIVIAPLTNARPGFDAQYSVVIRNKGNQEISQLNGVNFSYDPSKMDFLFANDTPSSVGPGTLSWDFANLSPFESRNIYISMHVHSPMDVPNQVNNGDILTFNATVNPIAGDENPADNTFQFNQTVVGSFDPNEIVCLEGEIVSPIEIGNYLHYTINFENTGTADAENIVVRDIIDTTQFDVSSLQLLDSSASVTTRLIGNVAEFIFPSIHLHSGGHGNILIKIRSNNTLVTGDTVSKKANIYFDYNFPVETAPENTIFQALSNPDVPVDATILVYPNPTKGSISINCNNTIKSVQLFDLQGRVLQTNLVNETQTTIDITSQSNGVYFLKVISDNGIGVQKIIKE